MPRRTAPALAVAPLGIKPSFPSAPSSLSKHAGEVWDSIIKSREPQFWDPAARVLLAQMCEHVVLHERLSAQIDYLLETGEATSARMGPLVKLRSIEANTTSGIAVKLGLAASSQLTQNAAREAVRNGGVQFERPWDDIVEAS